MRTVVVERIFQADMEVVFKLYWDIENWPKAIENIIDVNIDYDDGYHQYFSMIAANGDGQERVSGVRIGTPCRKLEMCQFSPPPGFKLMRGEWRFSSVADTRGVGTCVSAERVFAMNDPDREDAISSFLEALLAKNLLAFDSYLSRETA
jgi:Polyketide cyclase / dehydrase and lipid transport